MDGLTDGAKLIQAGVLLHDFVLCEFAIMQLENLHDFPNLRDNFLFNAIWHRRSPAALFLS
jgi:hypothetical protein